jgi:hypothetical protein
MSLQPQPKSKFGSIPKYGRMPPEALGHWEVGSAPQLGLSLPQLATI